jgi:hypothetical protein
VLGVGRDRGDQPRVARDVRQRLRERVELCGVVLASAAAGEGEQQRQATGCGAPAA